MPNNKHPMRLDANESAFFTRELEYVKSQSYDTKFKQLKAFDVIPISSEAPNGATEITFRRYTGIGLAKIIADYAHDFPRVDVYGTEETAKIRGVGTSYGYSIKEIRSSQMAGKSLDQRRANFARRANDEKVNSVAFSGDSEFGLQGLIDYPGITEYTVPNGTSGTTPWTTKTPDEIVADLTGMVNAIVDTTNGREAPDTLLLPIAQYNYIANTRMTGGDTTTILTFFLDNNPYINTVDWIVELKGAGASGGDRMMMYANDSEHLTLEMPQMFEQFDPQQKGMEFEIPCHSETAGVIVYYPLSVSYGDGI